MPKPSDTDRVHREGGDDHQVLLARFEEERRKGLGRALRLGGSVVAVVFLADGLVELATRPALYAATFWTRLGVGAFALAAVLSAKWLPDRLTPVLVVLLGIGVGSDVALAAAQSGGLTSPYVTGEVLLLAAVGLLFPLRLMELSVVIAAVWALDLTVIRPAGEYTVELLAVNVFFLAAATFVAVSATAWAGRLRLSDFLANAALKKERARSERLLLNILPESIAARLKASEAHIADAHPEVTVLFADIVGFTTYSASRSPREVVRMLDEIFSAFDALCAKHGLEKIKTIGDAFMAVAGLPEPREDHAQAAAAMALDMLREVETVAQRGNPGLQLRIGLHSGPVVAGVIGSTKFSYDLWGDTVNVASRMESHGEPGRIQISGEVVSRLDRSFQWEPRGGIPLKGRGTMEAFWLVGGGGGG